MPIKQSEINQDRERKRVRKGSPYCTNNRTETMSKTTGNRIFSFVEARRIVRAHGFDSREEFFDYECAGSYRVPKNADELYRDEWPSWDDFLGVPPSFQDGRKIARQLQLSSKQLYLDFVAAKKMDENDASSRLPHRPDLYYHKAWQNWNDWLGLGGA